jgi:hypothetical protein
MSKAFAIQWKSKVNGSTGRGTKTFDHEEAARLVEELNREYPQIEHEVVEAVPPAPEKPVERAASGSAAVLSIA